MNDVVVIARKAMIRAWLEKDWQRYTELRAEYLRAKNDN